MSNDSYYKALQAKALKDLQQSRQSPKKGAGGSAVAGALKGLNFDPSKLNVPTAPKVSAIEGAIGPGTKLGAILDIMSRPAYAVGNLLKETGLNPFDQKQTTDSKLFKTVAGFEADVKKNGVNPGNVFGALKGTYDATGGAIASGLAGRSKVMPSTQILSGWKPDTTPGQIAKGITGFGLDVGLDPSTYLGPGLVKGVGELAAKGAVVAAGSDVKALAAAGKAGVKATEVSKAISSAPGNALRKAGVLKKKAQALPAETTSFGPTNLKALESAPVLDTAPSIGPLTQAENTAAKTTAAKDLASSLSSKTAIQPTIQKIATAPRDAAGNLVYSDPAMFPKLSDISAEIAAKAAKKPASTKLAAETAKFPSKINLKDLAHQWAVTNADMPVSLTAKGLVVTPAEQVTADSLKLKDVYSKALSEPTSAAGKRSLAQIATLFKSQHPITSNIAGAPVAASSAGSALGDQVALAGSQIGGTEAILARPRGTGFNVRQAQAKADALARVAPGLSPEDLNYLARTRSPATFDTRTAEILSRKASSIDYPLQSSNAMDVPAGWTNAEGKPSVLQQMLGNTSDTPVVNARPTVALNPSDPVVEKAIRNTFEKQFVPEGIVGRSKLKDVARTSLTPGRGTAIADKGFNKRAQYQLWKDLMAPVVKELKGTKLFGEARASALKTRMMDLIDQSEAVLRSRGIEPILGEFHSGIPLSMGDILHALDSSAAGRQVLINHVFNARIGTVALTNLADAAEMLLRTMIDAGATKVDDAAKFIKDISAGKGEAGSFMSRLTEQITKDPGGNYSHTVDATTRRAENAVGQVSKTAQGEIRIVKGITKIVDQPRTFHTVNGKAMVKDMGGIKQVNLGGTEMAGVTRTILKGITDPGVVKQLVARANANAAAHSARMGFEVPAISEQVINEFSATWLKASTSTGDAIKLYKSTNQLVEDAALKINAMPDSVEASKAMADLVKSDIVGADAKHIQILSDLVKAVGSGDKVATQRLTQKLHDLVATEQAGASINGVPDIAVDIEATVETRILRALYPLETKTPSKLAAMLDKAAAAFIPGAGHATLRQALVAMRGDIRNVANHWRSELTQINHMYMGKSAELESLFAKIQKGIPAEGEGADRLTNLVKVLFETNVDGTEGVTGAFFRNGYDINHLNGHFARVQMPEGIAFDVAAAEKAAAASGKKVSEELAAQWRSWKITDPIDFMARSQAALQAVEGDAAISREAYRLAAEKGLASMTRREGFQQIFDSTGKSVMVNYLPKGAWYHPDIINEIRSMDNVLHESLSFDSDFGKFVNRYLDPALNMWKSGMTIYRPGHHLRNLVGDESFSFMADGVQRIGLKYDTIKVMGVKNTYSDWDALRAMRGLPKSVQISEADMVRGSAIVSKVKLKGGKVVNLTALDAQHGIRSRGVLPDFVSGEDLLAASSGGSKSIATIQSHMSIFGGRVRAAAGQVSEGRDDFVRISHFLQILEKNPGKFKTIDEAMNFAGARVRKWHPDGTDLTSFQTKYMRRMFPFYSWTAKSIPLVVESMLMHPGRVLVLPKATFNAAQAQGIDVKTLADPFPSDQLFPSSITDNGVGPVTRLNGNYYSVAPGVATSDVMGQFINSPLKGALSMLSPMIKAPLDLMYGKNIATGGNIADSGEYLDSSIPGVSNVGSLTNSSPLGTLANVASGNMSIDPKSSAVKAAAQGQPKATVGPVDLLSLINLLTGSSVQNQSTPSYINFAEIEKKKAAAAAALANRGK